MASWWVAQCRPDGARITVRKDKLMGRRRRTQAAWYRVTAVASSAAMLGVLGMAGTSMAATSGAATSGAASSVAKTRTAADATASCQLGNGVKHVVKLTFD